MGCVERYRATNGQSACGPQCPQASGSVCRVWSAGCISVWLLHKVRFQCIPSIRLRATTSTSGSGWLCRVEGVGCRCQGTERQVCMVTDHCVNRLLQGWGCRVEDVSFRVGGVWFWV